MARRFRATAAVLVGLGWTAGCGGGPGPACHYVLSQRGGGLTTAGGNIQIKVEAPSGCAWTFQSDVPWVSVHDDPPAPSGNGNGTVVATVPPNPGVRRAGTASIAFHQFTIDQGGTDGPGSCAFAVFPPGATSGAAGGAGGFAVVPNAPDCSWWVEAHSPDDDWLDDDFHQGVGLGVATYTVVPGAALPSVSLPRVGRIGLHDSTGALVMDHMVTQNP